MDFLSWLWWAFSTLLSLVWSAAWFLLGGWISALAQIMVLVAIVFFYKYGWQRAPAEIAARVSTLFRYVWSWVRQRETAETRVQVKDVVRTVRVKEAGDINVSSLLNVLMFTGLALIALI